MTAPDPPAATAWQQTFAEQLTALSRDGDIPLTVNEQRAPTSNGLLPVLVTVDTTAIAAAEGGLVLEPREQFEVLIRPDGNAPPAVTVRHNRFLGHPHVLHGRQLCIYLDPSREWDPANEATGFLNRLWTWLEDAAAARFSASDALYHATGGVPVGSSTDEVLVVRGDVPTTAARLWGTRRTAHRLDLVRQHSPDAIAVAFWQCGAPLPIGIGHTVGDLLDALTREGTHKTMAVLTTMRAQLRRNTNGQDPLYFLLAVPHPAGGPAQLIGGRLGAAAVNDLKAHAMATLRQRPVEWCSISDERDAVTTRRDSNTPAQGFLGAHVSLLGCGALGSWMAEFIVRAGAASVLLTDPATILGGLLVRQNFTEADLGDPKSTALARRLRQIADGVEILDGAHAALEAQIAAFTNSDFIIDATANVAAARQLELQLQERKPPHAVIARIATDPSSSTRGLAVVTGQGEARPLTAIDEAAESAVTARPDLEDFRPFWYRRPPGDQIIPTRGCSIPTFHGSAADVAAVAGTLVRLLGRHRDSPATGTHLFRLPGAGATNDVWLSL